MHTLHQECDNGVTQSVQLDCPACIQAMVTWTRDAVELTCEGYDTPQWMSHSIDFVGDVAFLPHPLPDFQASLWKVAHEVAPTTEPNVDKSTRAKLHDEPFQETHISDGTP